MSGETERGQLGGGRLELKDGGWGIEGYASTYTLDLVGDSVVRGAFAETLRTNPRPPLLWSHRPEDVIGVAQTLHEDDTGLYGTWKISRTSKGQDIRTLLLDGAVDGLSIGYRVRPDDTETRKGVRYLKRVDLAEISVVCLPANSEARVSRVKERPVDLVLKSLAAALAHQERRYTEARLAHLEGHGEFTRGLRDHAQARVLRAQVRIMKHKMALKGAR